VSSFGFWVETVLHKCEGLVNIVGLSDYDDFRLVDGDYSLVGRRSGRVFRIGDRVWIRVVSANLEKRQLDYEWVMDGKNGDEEEAGNTEKSKSKKKK
jgi:ribonuclease R